jgi:hypothetical protein
MRRPANSPQQQHELTANTGLGGGTAYGQTLGTAGGYILDTGQTRALYNQLGRAGVSSGQVRGVANDSAAFSRISGMDPQTVAQLAETQSVQGNMSDKDIAKFFDAIVVGAKTVGVSMNRLYDTFSAFGVATGNLALTLHGQLSLMGAQQAYGKSINAGSVGAGLETAQGTDVMKFASILGISQDQFMQYQANDPAKLQGLTLQFLNKQTQGLKGAQRLSTMEAIDQGIGDPLGLSGLNAKQAQTLLNTDPNKLINAAANIGKKVQPSGTDLTKTGQAYGGSDTGVVAKAFKQMETTSDGWLQKIATNTSDLISAVENVPKDLVNLLTNVVTNPSQGIPDALQQLLPGSGILNALVDPMMAPLDAGIGLLHSFGVGGGGGGGSADMPFGGAGSLYGNANPTTQYGWGWNGKTAAPGNQSGGGAPSSGGNPSRGGVRNGRTYKVSNTRGGIDTVSGALSDAYQFAAQQYGLNINDLLAIGARESDFNVNAHAPDGGQGIMQLQPDTVTQLLSGKGLKNDPFAGRQLTNKTQYDHDKYFNPYDMGDNVSAGAYWYAQKLAAAGGNEQLGLTGYNGYANGPGVVTSYGQQVSAAAQTVIMIQDATSGGVAVTARVNGKPVPIQKRGPRGGRGYGAQAQ